VWNLDNVDEEVHAIHRLSKPVDLISLTADGKKALATTRAGLSLWSLNDGRLIKYIPITGNSAIQRGLASVRVTICAIFVFDILSERILRVLKLHVMLVFMRCTHCSKAISKLFLYEA
jgi:hypothetical protein